jgi:hypothetical protein
MGHHFEHATVARDAVVRGDLAGAQQAAQELAADGGEIADLPGPSLDAMRAAARTLASARDVHAAALALGDVGRACGDCHRATDTRVEVGARPPPLGPEMRDRMRRHFWATDRLWDGLMAPDDDVFSSGAVELARAPLFAATPATAQTVAPEARAVADRVRSGAQRARRARDGATRARAYGEILSTCADCHRLVGAGGPVAPVAL